jgi:RNA polymerase sigma factor (sigma-70 family)
LSDVGIPLSPRQVAEAVLLDPLERSRLIRFADRRFGIDGADAEDLLQETALALLRQRGSVRSPQGYFFTSFRAACARHLTARRAFRERLRESDAEDQEVAHAPGVEQVDRHIALREALGGVSSICRRLLSAYYVEGLTLTEAAADFTMNYAALSQRISRCLKRLRACLN